MTKLNLAMLDGLERELQETVKAHVAGDSDATLRLDRARIPFDVECLAQLRSLLDLVGRMGAALKVAVPNLMTGTQWREDDPEYRQVDDALAAYEQARGD